MVPNHMGIDSTWVVERPDLFISSPYPPFESYSFTGGDLSSDDRVVIQLEDHYWDSSDAAVVFKRIDKGSGEERYTLQMLMNEHFGVGAGWKTLMLATDISATALRTAMAGVYDQDRVSKLPPALRNRYFTRERDGRAQQSECETTQRASHRRARSW